MKIKTIPSILTAALVCLGLAGCMSTDLKPSEMPSVTEPQGTSAQASLEAPATAEEKQSSEAYSEDVQKRAIKLLAHMTAEEKAGQIVLGRFPEENAVQDAQELHLGGYTLFARDFENMTPESFTAQMEDIQSAVPLGLLFAVDEEGGSVVRVSKFPQYRDEKFPSQSEVLESGGVDGVSADAAAKSALLRSLGLNMNLAPVCDLPRSSEDYIADRAFGMDCAEVSAAVKAAVGSYVRSGVICTLKHFPGYGNNSDTHTGISIDERPMSELESLDLEPFRAGISAGAPVVMVSHNIVKCVNKSLPGSLSPEMYTLLRDELGFSGVIMTDDLSMGAVEEYCGEDEAAVTAFLAGADLLCCTDYQSAVKSLTEALDSGRITEERLDESVMRILEMKLGYGIIE